MLEESQSYKWERAIKQLFSIGGVIPSSIALRKYFKKHYSTGLNDRTNIYLADVYGHLVCLGYSFAKDNQLDTRGFFSLKSEDIAEGLTLSVRTIRYITNILFKFGLIEILKVKGEANSFRVNSDKFEEIVVLAWAEDDYGDSL